MTIPEAEIKQQKQAVPLFQEVTGTALSGDHWLRRLRFQLPAMAAFVLLLQLTVLYIFDVPVEFQATLWVSLVATQIANLVGALSLRAMHWVPGTRKLGFILPTITACYGVLILAAFAFRIPYSVSLVGVGYAGALTMMWVFNSRLRPSSRETLYLIKSPQTDELMEELPQLPFSVLESSKALAALSQGAVIVDLREELASDWEREIARAVLRGIPVYHVKQAYESLTGKVRFDHISENHFGSLVPSLSYLVIKRVIDLLLSVVALIVLCIPMLVIAALIRMTSSGPAIFRHTRIGHRGVMFEAYKFRTMQQRKQDKHDLDSQITLHADPRITKFGRFLRETRLDELPQLINVVLGQMSLIGPRPEAQALSEWYRDKLDFYEYRHVVRPGITGWAQINQGHVTSIEDIFHKTQYDFYYIKNLSPSMDFLIALKTIEIMFSRRGAR